MTKAAVKTRGRANAPRTPVLVALKTFLNIFPSLPVTEREVQIAGICSHRWPVHEFGTRRCNFELTGCDHAHCILERHIAIEIVNKDRSATVSKFARAVPVGPLSIRQRRSLVELIDLFASPGIGSSTAGIVTARPLP